jgi:hypothetical protein
MTKAYLGLAIVALLAAFTTPLGFCPDCTAQPQYVAQVGMCLQLSGMFLVFFGIRSRGEAFGVPSMVASVRKRVATGWSWIGRKLGRIEFRHYVASVSPATYTLRGSAATVFVLGNQTLKERVDALTEEITRLRADIAATERIIAEIRDDTRRQYADLRNQNVDLGQHFEGRMKAVLVGDHKLEWIAAALICVGIILTSIPDRVADWIA